MKKIVINFFKIFVQFYDKLSDSLSIITDVCLKMSSNSIMNSSDQSYSISRSVSWISIIFSALISFISLNDFKFFFKVFFLKRSVLVSTWLMRLITSSVELITWSAADLITWSVILLIWISFWKDLCWSSEKQKKVKNMFLLIEK